MILYLDVLAIMFRAYHAIPDLKNADGLPTGALYGLLTTLFRVVEELRPEKIIACFDRPEQTLRQELDENYKANRDLPEEDMVIQLQLAEEVLKAFGVDSFSKAGYEADDIIGTLATNSANNGEEVVVVTCDGDLLQLTTNPKIRVYMLRKGMSDFILYDEKEAEKKNKYKAKYITDYKGLAGDSSDNIKGVAGIGQVTATNLINKYGDLEKIYEAVSKNALIDDGFRERVLNLLKEGREMAFKSKELATIHVDVPIKPNKKIFENSWLEKINLSEAEKTLEMYDFKSLINRLRVLTKQKQTSENKTASPDVLDEYYKKAKILTFLLGGEKDLLLPEVILEETKQKNFKDAVLCLEELAEKEGLEYIWKNIEEPLISILEDMQKEGIKIDLKLKNKLSKKYQEKLEKLEKEIYKLAGREFNINSPKQLSEVLYKELNLSPKSSKKTSTGAKTTKEEVLLSLRDDHLIIDLILEYRHYKKLKTTYVDSLGKYIDEEDKIHTEFNQIGTVTGRLSSNNPNLQNIPNRGEDSKDIRSLFIAEEGFSFLSVDYSQIELRIAAILSGDEKLISAFEENKDIHKATADEVFGEADGISNKDKRTYAKTINFGILYGQGARALSQQLKISLEDAKNFIEKYKETYSQLMEYMENIIVDARENGYTKTAYGRKRKIFNINSTLHFVRAQAERFAINAPIQGTAADVIKLALINIVKEINKQQESENIKPILQIHDELVFEIKNEKLKKARDMIVKQMESIKLPQNTPITLKVNSKAGKSLGHLE